MGEGTLFLLWSPKWGIGVPLAKAPFAPITSLSWFTNGVKGSMKSHVYYFVCLLFVLSRIQKRRSIYCLPRWRLVQIFLNVAFLPIQKGFALIATENSTMHCAFLLATAQSHARLVSSKNNPFRHSLPALRSAFIAASVIKIERNFHSENLPCFLTSFTV